VFSVKGSRGGWMIQGEAVGRIVDIDTNRQAGQLQYTAGAVPGVGSSITYSTVEPSKIYKNGKPVNITLHGESAPVTSGGVPIAFPDGRFIGVGVTVVEGSKRMLAVAALPNIHGVFVGDCGLFYADSPYKRVRFAQEFHVECNVGGTRQVPYFIFNESGTRASAIAYRQWGRKGVAEDGSELVSQTVETDVVHLDIGEGGTSCTATVEVSEGCPYRKETVRDSYSSQTNQFGGPSGYTTSTTTKTIGPYQAAVAIGYDGDLEKRLTVTYSETASSTSYSYNLKVFSVFNCTPAGIRQPDNLWLPTDQRDIYDTASQVTLIYQINGDTLASLGFTREQAHGESGHQYNTVRRWNYMQSPLSASQSSPDAFLAALREECRSWNPAGWDAGGWDIQMEANPFFDGIAYDTYFTRNDNKYDPDTGWQYEWGGWMTFNFLLIAYSNEIAANNDNTRVLRDKYIILLAADLINDEVYYATLEVTDNNGVASTSFQIMCNGEALYSE
jgi:hypothetical protein